MKKTLLLISLLTIGTAIYASDENSDKKSNRRSRPARVENDSISRPPKMDQEKLDSLIQAGVIDTTNMNEALRMVEASRRIRVQKETLPSGAENNKTPLVVKAPLCKVSLA